MNQSNNALDNTNAEAMNIYNASMYAHDNNNGLRPNINSLAVGRNSSESSPRSPSYLKAPEVLMRVKKKVSATSLEGKMNKDPSESWSNPDINEEEQDTKEKITFSCRICLCDGDYEEEQRRNKLTNPLVSPCDCSGNNF